MLASIVGPVDINSAAVLCVLFIAMCIATTTAIGRRRSKQELTMQFEVDKQRLRNEDDNNKRNSDQVREYQLAKIAAERDVNFKRIDSGLIEGKAIRHPENG